MDSTTSKKNDEIPSDIKNALPSMSDSREKVQHTSMQTEVPTRRFGSFKAFMVDMTGAVCVVDRNEVQRISLSFAAEQEEEELSVRFAVDEESEREQKQEENITTPPPRESLAVSIAKAPSRMSRMMHQGYTKLFGVGYNAREATFVLFAGALVAFNMGFINGACVSGLLDPNRQASQSVVGVSSQYTKSSLAVAGGHWINFGTSSGFIASYMLGSFLCGFITPRATAYQIEPSYGPTFMIGGCFLLAASVLAALEYDTRYVFYLVIAANGVQNGIASIYSQNLIRCSLTGASTDIAIAIGRTLRGNRTRTWQAMVLAILILNFWIGGLVSYYTASRFLSKTLIFNAGLFFLIGLALIVFLVREIGISVGAAIFGNWKWKKGIKKLSPTATMLGDGSESDDDNSVAIMELFDKIDHDDSLTITMDELLESLLEANVQVSTKKLQLLMKAINRKVGRN